MSVIYGTREVATIGPRKHVTITYPAPRETLLESPVALPTSEPVDPMITFTVGAGDIPVLTGIPPSAATYVAYVYVAGQNLVADGQSIQFETFLNGVSTSGGPISPAPLTHNCFTIQFSTTVVQGDVVGVSLWDATPDELQYDYIALVVGVTQPGAAAENTLLLNTVYSDFMNMPALTLGSPDFNNPRGTNAYNGSNNIPIELFDGLNVNAFCVYKNLYRLTDGDRSVLLTVEDTPTRPFYNPMIVPTDITYYPTSIRVV